MGVDATGMKTGMRRRWPSGGGVCRAEHNGKKCQKLWKGEVLPLDGSLLMGDSFDGFLLGKRYLLHDRDTKFIQAFDALLKASEVEPVLLPARSPNLNAHCQRFIRSIKEEALERMVMLGERALHHAIHQYLTHYHTERNHQGLDNRLIAPECVFH